MEELIPQIMNLVAKIVLLIFTYVCLPTLTQTVIPWLKEKRLDGIIKKYVEAAEKMAASGQLVTPKKDYVMALLSRRGITITDEVEASIESAVIELDHATAQALYLFSQSMSEESEVKI